MYQEGNFGVAEIDTFELLQDMPNRLNGWIFRGQKEMNWPLQTSIERCIKRLKFKFNSAAYKFRFIRDVEKREYECGCIREFQRHARSFLPHVPDQLNTLEWLAMMQHFGAPTRLLDFTESFWIAVFFAYEEAEEDCVVWAVDKSTLGNGNTLKREFPQMRNLDFNKALRENINSGSYETESVYQDVPFYTNERLAIQKGTFLFTLNNVRPISELIEQNHKGVLKVKIDRVLFPMIRKHMNDLNCNARVLFPGIDGYARYFKNHTY
jgi:FRG domain-containing protein